MVPDTVADTQVVNEAEDAEVMASIEEDETFILADVTRDGAYLTMPLEGAASLPAWR